MTSNIGMDVVRISPASLMKDMSGYLLAPIWRRIWGVGILLSFVTDLIIFRLLPFTTMAEPKLEEALPLVSVVLVKFLYMNALLVAALRCSRHSNRGTWKPDGSWWVSLILMLVVMTLAPVLSVIFTSLSLDLWIKDALSFIVAIPLILVFARWRAAIAIDGKMSGPGIHILKLGQYLVPAIVMMLILLLPLTLATDWAKSVTGDRQAYGMDIAFAALSAILGTALILSEAALLGAIHRQTTVEPNGVTG